jgi:hypothetical protein
VQGKQDGLFTVYPKSLDFNSQLHCSRRRIAGSIPVARRAGIQVASSPNNIIASTTAKSTRGSLELA